jgi:hypothetical protein
MDTATEVPNPAAIIAGKGELLQDSTHIGKDMPIIRRAIRHGWLDGWTAERRAAIARAMEDAAINAETVRDRAAAARVLASMDRADIAARAAEDPKPAGANFSGPVQINLANLSLADLEALRDIQDRLADTASLAGPDPRPAGT